MKISTLGAFAAVIVGSATVRAEATLPFDLESLALRATDIAVVERVDATRVKVLETWVGNLAVGDPVALRVPESTTCCPRKPLGKRAVVFLVREGAAWRGAAHDQLSAADSLRISIAWIDGTTSFAYAGHSLDGRNLDDLHRTESQLRGVVIEYKDARHALDLVDGLPSVAKQLETLDGFLRHKRRDLARTAVARLGRLGDPAVAPIRKLLRDDQLSDLHEAAVSALAAAAGGEAPKQLGALLADETVFWEVQTPLLGALVKRSTGGGWWNALNPADPAMTKVSKLRLRYSVAFAALRSLGRIGDAGSRPAVKKFCTRWAALPVMGYDTIADARGTRKVPSSQLTEACTAALRR